MTTKDNIDAPDIKTSIIFWTAVALSVVQLTVPIFLHLLDLQLRAIHVGIGLSLAVLVFPFSKRYRENKLTTLDIVEPVSYTHLDVYKRQLCTFVGCRKCA